MEFERDLEPTEETHKTIKLYCSFETYVTVIDGDREYIEEQLSDMDWSDFLDESSKAEIEDWEVAR